MSQVLGRKSFFLKEKFSGLVYSSQKIQGKEFENCIFSKSVFIKSNFEDCTFIDCVFSECSISANKPFNSKFNNISFKDSKVMGFDWSKTKSIQTLSFEQCDVSYSNFSFLKLTNFKLIECVAHDVGFNEADLTGAIFTKTDFSKAVFSHTNLSKADFRQAFNYGIDFNFNNLKKAKFSLPEAASLLKSLDIVIET